MNRATVARHWKQQQPLSEMLDDLGKQALHVDPALRHEVGIARARTHKSPQASPLTFQGKPAPQPTPSADVSWEQRVVRRVVEQTLHILERSQPDELLRYGRHHLHRVMFGETDLLDVVAREAAWDDPNYRKQMAALALERLEAEVDAAVAKRSRRKRPAKSDFSRQLVKELKRRNESAQGLEIELVKALGAALGPGGGITALLAGMFAPFRAWSRYNDVGSTGHQLQ